MAWIEKTREIPAADPIFRQLIENYISLGGEHERSAVNIFDQMVNCDPERGGLWLVKQDDSLAGFLFAEVIRTDAGTNGIMIHAASVLPTVRRNIWLDMDAILWDWGQRWHVKDLFFLTRRNPKSFARRLNTNWKLDAYVMRRHFPELESEPAPKKSSRHPVRP